MKLEVLVSVVLFVVVDKKHESLANVSDRNQVLHPGTHWMKDKDSVDHDERRRPTDLQSSLSITPRARRSWSDVIASSPLTRVHLIQRVVNGIDKYGGGGESGRMCGRSMSSIELGCRVGRVRSRCTVCDRLRPDDVAARFRTDLSVIEYNPPDLESTHERTM